MKKYLLLTFLTLLCWSKVNAEELRFVYIAHDIETATDKLVRELSGLQRAAREGVPTIFYLSNADSPIIAYYNVKNKKDGEIYREILGELQERSFHNTSAIVDRETIVSIFENLLADNHIYDKITWKFYITQNYWNMYNEEVIASSYFILDIADWTHINFLLQIYYSGAEKLNIDDNYPFGKLNLCPTINSNYELLYL